MDDLERLKEVGAPKLAAAKAEQNDKIERLIQINIKQLDELITICEYKKLQRDGDIRFRKGSAKTSMLSVGIALTALWISIAGVGVVSDVFDVIIMAMF